MKLLTCSLIQRITIAILCWGGKIPFDRLRWFIEDKVRQVFAWAYEGSDEELEAVENCEIPPKHMSARQRAHMLAPADYAAHCCHCQWQGSYRLVHQDDCPRCGTAVWLSQTP